MGSVCPNKFSATSLPNTVKSESRIISIRVKKRPFCKSILKISAYPSLTPIKNVPSTIFLLNLNVLDPMKQE